MQRILLGIVVLLLVLICISSTIYSQDNVIEINANGARFGDLERFNSEIMSCASKPCVNTDKGILCKSKLNSFNRAEYYETVGYIMRECHAKRRIEQLMLNSDIVSSSDERLNITLANGTELFFENKRETRECADCVKTYVYEYFLNEVGFHVVTESRYEEWQTYLVGHASGKQTKILGGVFENLPSPLFSPTGVRLVSYYFSEMAGNNTGLEIWKISKDELILEYAGEVSTYFADIPRWVSDTELHLVNMSIGNSKAETSTTILKLNQDGSWRSKLLREN